MTTDITGVVCGQVVFQNNAEGARLYGCGGSFTGLHDFIVCADCGMAMHLACFRKHCQSDLAAALRSAEQAQDRLRSVLAADTSSLRMNGYYIGFDRTGVAVVDRILSAVACAGKAAHHTDCWHDHFGEAYEGVRGNTCNEWIQNAADDAAKALRGLLSPASPGNEGGGK